MRHRVVVLGAGYAGLPAVKRLARQLRPDDVDITLVTASDRFVERPRLHQMATGQKLKDVPLMRYLRNTGVSLRVGRVERVDTAAKRITVSSTTGKRELTYDTLVYALGSNTDTEAVRGVGLNAHVLGGHDAAERLHAGLRGLADTGGAVVVVGGGLTGIETAAEVAESFPSLDVRLVTAGTPGQWLSAPARRYIDSTFETLRVQVTGGARVREVARDHVLLDDGSRIAFQLCIWAGGFTVSPLARVSGLDVNAQGRIIVDRFLRARSHTDVWALGDAAAIPGPWGDALAMGCRTSAFTVPVAADNVAASLTGRPLREFTYRYFHECISLGRRRGVVQFLHKDETPKNFVLKGRVGLSYKDAVLNSAIRMFRWPGPYVPRPTRAVIAHPHQAVAIGDA